MFRFNNFFVCFCLDDDLSDDDDDESQGSEDDVNRYGSAYAKYKKRVLNRNNYFESVVDDDGDYMSDFSSQSDDWEHYLAVAASNCDLNILKKSKFC